MRVAATRGTAPVLSHIAGGPPFRLTMLYGGLLQWEAILDGADEQACRTGKGERPYKWLMLKCGPPAARLFVRLGLATRTMT